jgi:glycosyltransferase involved in cell wall biosynthesis
MVDTTYRFAVTDCPIFVDISPLFERQLTGIGRFVLRLVEAMSRLIPLRLFGGPLDGDDIVLPPRTLGDVDASVPDVVRAIVRRPRSRRHDQAVCRGAAVYTALRPAYRRFRKELGVLYDFTTLLLPWCHSQKTRIHFARFFDTTAKLCDKLVAISRSTLNDARWLLSRSENDVVFGYPGPSMCVHRHAGAKLVERRRDKFLVVSALEPRKNPERLIDWFQRTSQLDGNAELWWVGPEAWWISRKSMRRFSARRGKGTRAVKLFGMVPEADLCDLYRQAEAVIYPSLYEGFGFPVLDSLMHATPVLASFNSSLTEFDMPGVFYFDPFDPASLDDALANMRSSPRICINRDRLREQFSWDQLARTIIGLCA